MGRGLSKHHHCWKWCIRQPRLSMEIFLCKLIMHACHTLVGNFHRYLHTSGTQSQSSNVLKLFEQNVHKGQRKNQGMQLVRIQERKREKDFQAKRGEEGWGGKFLFFLLDYLKVLCSSSLVMPQYNFHLGFKWSPMIRLAYGNCF